MKLNPKNCERCQGSGWVVCDGEGYRCPCRLIDLVEAIKQANTAGWVCDSVQECKGWQEWHYDYDFDKDWKFCPFCGKPLDWQNWERLKK